MGKVIKELNIVKDSILLQYTNTSKLKKIRTIFLYLPSRQIQIPVSMAKKFKNVEILFVREIQLFTSQTNLSYNYNVPPSII